MEPKNANLNPIPRIQWQITDLCNYKCEYCIQGQYDKTKMRKGHATGKTIEAVLDVLSELQGSWMINLSGGEATIHPNFFEICREIIKRKHTINLTTNFFLSRDNLRKLVGICGDKLEVVTASLHISQINVDDFIKKAAWFNSIKNQKTKFLVTLVMVEENFEQIKEIREKANREGVTLKFQAMKQIIGRDKKFVEYSEHVENYIEDNLARGTEKIRNKSFFGKKCHAGDLFFIIKTNGNAYRCYESQPGGYLGNITKGTFERFTRAMPCLSRKCMCPVPANHNMILFNEKASSLELAKHLSKSIVKDKKYYKNKLLQSRVLAEI